MMNTLWFVTWKVLSSTESSGVICASSFCGFTVARAIDMNLDLPFLYNPLSKNDENFVIYCLESVEF